MLKKFIFLWFILISTATQISVAADNAKGNSGQASPNRTGVASHQCPELKTEETTNLEMVNKVLEDKKPYAALAFIDSFDTHSPQLELLKANSLRKVGREAEAEAIYTKLTESCIAAYAYQGLGLISYSRNKPADSVKFLKQATKLLPINAYIRSDHGFALMQSGDYPSALNEFLTAIELDDRNIRAKYNLLVLLYKSNQADKADQFAKRYKISETELQNIRNDARGSQTSINVAAKADGQVKKSTGACMSDSNVCTGILSMKLENYAYE